MRLESWAKVASRWVSWGDAANYSVPCSMFNQTGKRKGILATRSNGGGQTGGG